MKTNVNVFTPYHYTSENIKMMLEKYIKNGDSVLDIGTGSGVLAITAKQMGAGRVLAVDIQNEAVELATENVKDYGLDVEVKRNYLNFNIDEKFDITIANLDVNQELEFLQYAKNTMKDDGILMLTWAKGCFEDSYIRRDFTVLEHTEDYDYNVYILKK